MAKHQEKTGFNWPWDYLHFQVNGRGSIFANAEKGKFMSVTFFAEWLVFWFALLMTTIVSAIQADWALPGAVGRYFATIGIGFVVSFILAWFFFVFIIGPLTMSIVQYDFRSDFRDSNPRELMFSKKSWKFWIWGILVDTMIIVPLATGIPFALMTILGGAPAAVAWSTVWTWSVFWPAYWKAWVLAIGIIVVLLIFLKWQIGPNKKLVARMQAKGS
ncbi:MAG: hypothetical protein FK732_02415 [Asgard group archaeon]|nr:hypothetical protein [Asgard group archaeon]